MRSLFVELEYSLRYYYILILLTAFNTTVFNTYATSWTELKVNDPIKPGSECLVNEVVSFGGYVFDWPSKYDQIFFPYTSSLAIWFCRDSGFIAFMGDFDNITAEEKSKIASYLLQHPQENIKSLLSKLELLETLYSFRKISPESRNMHKRILAYLYEQINEYDKANDFRKSALRQIYELLNTDLALAMRLEYLYIAANYERQLGSIVNSELMLTRLITEIKDISDTELKSFGDYLLKLSKETPDIKPGGTLAPSIEKESTPKPNGMIQKLIDKFPTACHEEINGFFKNIEPIYTNHFNRTLFEKNVAELIDIRRTLIDTGYVPHSTISEYYKYAGVGQQISKEVEHWKNITSPTCQSYVNAFYDVFLLEASQHIEGVVSTIVSDITGIRDVSLYKGETITIEQVDQTLINKSLFYLYCSTKDYDVDEDAFCPEKSQPYKDTFIKLKADIVNSPLNVTDEVEIQKLFDAFAALGI